VLGLYSTYEREHAALGLLSLANFTEDDVLQFHTFTYKDKISFFSVAE
jgi:hypothetical protein